MDCGLYFVSFIINMIAAVLAGLSFVSFASMFICHI
ncbi:hypothetical protein BVRB_5g122440 [Beta vulgaris subsp. vulgaris]|nr:hypothetical protein BVRB_5g122440 [Beta vulgaris subsp. vulgaris]